jgi:hypothetical protein
MQMVSGLADKRGTVSEMKVSLRLFHLLEVVHWKLVGVEKTQNGTLELTALRLNCVTFQLSSLSICFKSRTLANTFHSRIVCVAHTLYSAGKSRIPLRFLTACNALAVSALMHVAVQVLQDEKTIRMPRGA